MLDLRLSPEATASFIGSCENVDFQLGTLDVDFALGLDAATRAIWNTPKAVCKPGTLSCLVQSCMQRDLDTSRFSDQQLNIVLASLVRAVVTEHGWVAGWKVLMAADPDSGLHAQLVQDVQTGVDVYKQVSVSDSPRVPIDVKLRVVRESAKGEIAEIGPKTMGGHTWKTNQRYLDAMKQWGIPEEFLFSPCVLLAWVGSIKKVVPKSEARQTQSQLWAVQLLGIIDYDLDRNEYSVGAYEHIVVGTAKMAASNSGKLRGTGWTGLMTMDQQVFNRHIQTRWVEEDLGSFVRGAEEFSPKEFAIAGYTDNAALAPFAYRPASEMSPSRTAMFVGVFFSNMYDFVYDMGCSSRISMVAYADTHGVFEHDIPQAWAIGFIDAIVKNIVAGPPDQQASAGDNALLIVCAWDVFNIRYRTWERCIKYMRLLARSKSPIAAGIRARSVGNVVLKPDTLDVDIGEAFTEALKPENVDKLIDRDSYTHTYALANAADVLAEHGIDSPDLCEKCASPFERYFHREADEIKAVPGISDIVSLSDAVSIASSVRWSCVFASSGECCDECACKIGEMANVVSETVLILVMAMEPNISARDFLCLLYLVGSVAFDPMRVITVLAGFDLNAEIEYEVGAMGERDVVDD